MTEAAGSSETFGTCQTTQRHVQEDHNLNIHLRKNLEFITVSPGKLQIKGRRHFPSNFPMYHWMGQPSAHKEEECSYEDIHPEREKQKRERSLSTVLTFSRLPCNLCSSYLTAAPRRLTETHKLLCYCGEVHFGAHVSYVFTYITGYPL